MGKLFGTDGIRGVVNAGLDADLAFKVGLAAAQVLSRDKAAGNLELTGRAWELIMILIRVPNKRENRRRSTMDVRLGDVLEMKKAHPCGSKRWLVLRVGMDFRLRCQGCGHEVMLPRSKAEKSIRKLIREGEETT